MLRGAYFKHNNYGNIAYTTEKLSQTQRQKWRQRKRFILQRCYVTRCFKEIASGCKLWSEPEKQGSAIELLDKEGKGQLSTHKYGWKFQKSSWRGHIQIRHLLFILQIFGVLNGHFGRKYFEKETKNFLMLSRKCATDIFCHIAVRGCPYVGR